MPGGSLDDDAVAGVVQNFHDLHMQLYAHNNPDKPVEFVSGRVAAIGVMFAPTMQKHNGVAGGEIHEQRQVYFDESQRYEQARIVQRASLGAGSTVQGPAIIEQMDTTTVVHPGQRLEVDEFGNLLISVGG